MKERNTKFFSAASQIRVLQFHTASACAVVRPLLSFDFFTDTSILVGCYSVISKYFVLLS